MCLHTNIKSVSNWNVLPLSNEANKSKDSSIYHKIISVLSINFYYFSFCSSFCFHSHFHKNATNLIATKCNITNSLNIVAILRKIKIEDKFWSLFFVKIATMFILLVILFIIKLHAWNDILERICKCW